MSWSPMGGKACMLVKLLACWVSVCGALPATGNGIVAYATTPRPARAILRVRVSSRIAVHR
eukprot:10656581-Alexandrium_andersonii.AAC.1